GRPPSWVGVARDLGAGARRAPVDAARRERGTLPGGAEGQGGDRRGKPGGDSAGSAGGAMSLRCAHLIAGLMLAAASARAQEFAAPAPAPESGTAALLERGLASAEPELEVS